LLGQETLTGRRACLVKEPLQKPLLASNNVVCLGTGEMKKTATPITLALVFLAATSLVAVEIQESKANPYHRIPDYTEIPPPAGTQAPIIIIQTPQNGSFHPKNVTLTFDVIIPKTNDDQSYGISELYYKGNWDPNEIIPIPRNFVGNTSYSIDLSDVRGGNLTITIYCVGVCYIETGSELVDSVWLYTHYDWFEMANYSTVSFTKDLIPPRISVLSPQNTTYTTPDVKLDFTFSEDVSQILYSLDNKGNQTISGNATLTGLLNGEHSVTLFAADLAGNAVSSKTLFFNVNSPEPFPIVPVAVATVISLILLCTGLMVYLKKRNARGAQVQHEK